MSKDTVDIDQVLGDSGLGLYQLTVCGLMGLVLMFSNISPLSYAITASDLNYRCEIPQCDTDELIYNPHWLTMAVPYKFDNVPHKCLKYRLVSEIDYITDSSYNSTCQSNIFNTTITQKCDDNYVFENIIEKTIVNDFNIFCEENKWKLTMVGTINSIGQLVGIPFAGFISDKYGRKFILIAGTFISAVFGLLQSFTVEYYTFVFCEFFSSVFSSGVYAATFVLGLELVSPNSRILISTLIGCFYPLGAIIMGFVAYVTLNWRLTLRVIYTPALLIIAYIWCVPESVRWLLSQNRVKEVVDILSNVAKSNGKTLSPHIRESLFVNSNVEASKTAKENQMSLKKLIKNIFNSRKIFLRLVNCSFCWTTLTLVYYGLSLISMELSGDKYINFMLSNVIEIPSYFASWYTMEHYSRRKTQAFSFLFSGIGCIMVNAFSNNQVWTILLFLTSKFAICIAFNIVYVYTAEMFPTDLRMSLFGITSTFGRMGVMIASQMTLLGDYYGKFVPVLMFSIISFIAAALSLFLPETKDKKLPDTIKEAELVV